MPINVQITGFERALFGFRDSNGIATGQQSTLSNGATSPAYVVDLPRTASFDSLAPVNLNIEGGDVLYNIVQFGNSKIQPFDLIISNQDQTAVELISGSVSNTTNTQVTYISDNPARSTPRVIWLALQSKAYDNVTSQQYYVTKFFPQCLARIKRKGPAFQALSDVVISCTPQMTNKTIEGRVFGTAGLNMQLRGDRADNYDYVSNNPIHVTSFRQDAVTTTFTSAYRPVSSTITLNATPNNFFVNGVSTALSAIVPTTGVATLTAAGSASVGDVLIYETLYVPV